MENINSLYEKARAGREYGWAYLPLAEMIGKNGEQRTREFLESEIKAHAQRDASPYRKGEFCLNAEPYYEGYATLRTWNGWQMPAFEFSECQRIAETLGDGVVRISYDAKADAFVVRDLQSPDDEPEVYAGKTIRTEDGPKKVYAIGAGAWCWDRKSE